MSDDLFQEQQKTAQKANDELQKGIQTLVISTVSAELGQLKSQVVGLETSVGDVKSEIGEVKSEMGDVKAAVERIELALAAPSALPPCLPSSSLRRFTRSLRYTPPVVFCRCSGNGTPVGQSAYWTCSRCHHTKFQSQLGPYQVVLQYA